MHVSLNIALKIICIYTLINSDLCQSSFCRINSIRLQLADLTSKEKIIFLMTAGTSTSFSPNSVVSTKLGEKEVDVPAVIRKMIFSFEVRSANWSLIELILQNEDWHKSEFIKV